MTILDLARQAHLDPKWVAGTAGGEYHSPCPVCQGKDRFFIQPHKQTRRSLGSFCCRRCGINGDSIKFAQEFLGFTYTQAMDYLGIPQSTHLWLNSHTPRTTTLIKPSPQWIECASHLVEQAHQEIFQQNQVIEYLASRGLPLEAVKRYQLGWLSKDLFLDQNEWGITNFERKLWIPRGLLIPITQTNGEVIRLKVRRANYSPGDKLPKYIAISGSMNGLSLIGDINHPTMIAVESELDAFAIDNALHDRVVSVAVGSNIKNPDNITDHYAKKAKKLFICHDNDEAGKKMLVKWQKLYLHAQALQVPNGKDIGEAIQNGLNIKEWLLSKMRI